MARHRALVVTLGLAAVAAGCGGSRPRLAESELVGRRVGDVDIVGNRGISDDDIIEVLAHRPRDGWIWRTYTHYDPLALQVDRRRVVALYRQRGYFAARVTSAKIGRDGGDVTIQIRVAEGEPTRVKALTMEGAPPELRPRLARVSRRAGLAPGTPLIHARYLEAKDQLRAAMIEAGYATASLEGTIEVDRQGAGASVRLRLVPGPRARFGDTRVVGGRDVHERVVRERLDWSPGDTFDPDAVGDTRLRLLQLGVFNSVRLDTDPRVDAEIVDVRVQIHEGKRNLLKLGGGTTFDPARLELHALARYSRKGVLDPLTTLRAELRPGFVILSTDDLERDVTFEGVVGLERIDFIVPRLRGRINASVERQVLEAYTSLGPGLRAGFDRPLGTERVRAAAGWSLRALLDVDYPDMVIEEALALETPYRVAAYDQSLTVDLRDQPILPSRGAFLQLRLEEGGAAAGGAFEYIRAGAEIRGYLPLGSVVVAGRGRVGWLDARGEEPITERFFSGGAGHRGFGFRRLSPAIVDEEGQARPVGGAGLLETGLELRIPFASIKGFPFRWVVFADLGDVQPALEDIDAGNLHAAAGAGIRWDLPIGPLRLDLARRINRLEALEPDGTPNPEPGAAWALHFSLGEAF
jgi:outer membrane protein assembly factor BamA